MAEQQELKIALTDVLEKRGVLSEVQARIRAEVYKALQDDSVSKPVLCEENLLINELIRDYLRFNQYKYTDSVLVAETGQQKECLERDFLAKQLHIPVSADHSAGNDMPLLYLMLAHFLHKAAPSSSEQLDDPPTPVKNTPPKPRTMDTRCIVEEPLFPDI